MMSHYLLNVQSSETALTRPSRHLQHKSLALKHNVEREDFLSIKLSYGLYLMKPHTIHYSLLSHNVRTSHALVKPPASWENVLES